METKQNDVMRIWRRCFNDSREYVDMYFSEVYRDDDCLTLQHEGQTVASLLLQPYSMRFHADMNAPAGYICGAATLPEWRNHGFMTRLMHKALRESLTRGYVFAMLIPADENLALYYRRFGFSPAFRVDRQRYTSLHEFRPKGEFFTQTDLYSDTAYRFFTTMMKCRPSGVQHTRRQFDCIVIDNSADGGSMAGVCDTTGDIRGMAFVVPHDDTAVVADLLATDSDAAEATLAEVRRQYSGQPIEVIATPGEGGANNQPRGMIRIVDVMDMFQDIAEANPRLQRSIRLHDRIINDNNGVFTINNGHIDRYPLSHATKTDLDVDIEVMASIVFGNQVTADIFNFPSQQPFMSLMLD